MASGREPALRPAPSGPGVFSSIDEAIADVRAGRLLIVVDDEDRENEGDLILAAERVTPEAINFIIKEARGVLCMAIEERRARELNLELMAPREGALHQTAFTVSVDAKRGTSTGTSAHDRCATVRTLVDPATRAEDLARPGHIFPLIAVDGGVLKRAGHTEAVVDLARLAGLTPAGVLCEILDEDGGMARVAQLTALARRHDLKLVTIADLIAYRQRREKLVRRLTGDIRLPSRHGQFQVQLYENILNGEQHLALVKGAIRSEDPVMVRVHSECLTGDAFGSLRCDCGEQLRRALEMIESVGSGVVLYLRGHEGRGIGLHNKLKAYELQDHGRDTVEANLELGYAPDLRNYGIGAQILVDLGIRRMRLLTNNPTKIVALQGYGLEVVERVPIEIASNLENDRYLRAKRDKLGHLL